MGWNGKNDKGNDHAVGIYTCLIEYTNSKNERVVKNTSVTLVR
jgi:flagellar hook assembly protein FlgD